MLREASNYDDDNAVRTYTYKSGAVYEGTFNGTRRDGHGHWQHPKGEVYDGEYIDNRQHGLGMYLFTETRKCYIGNWFKGKMNGEGVYYFNRERTVFYYGNYTEDQKNGDGYYMYESGIMTTQVWDMGRLVSEQETKPEEVVEVALRIRTLTNSVRAVTMRELGEHVVPSEIRTFQFPSGATYTGQYSGTKKHGQGYWLHPEGDRYEGQFECNKHNGWGVYIIGPSGKKYVGEWRDGKMDGVGVYFFNSQETEYFVGVYRNDVKHGIGMYHFSESNRSRVQLWEHGTLKQESDANEVTESDFVAAIKRIVHIVAPFAPNYKPVAFDL